MASDDIDEILGAAEGAKWFTAPGPCSGNFMALVAINGDAEVTITASSNTPTAVGKNLKLLQGVPHWIRTSNPILVAGQISAYNIAD